MELIGILLFCAILWVVYTRNKARADKCERLHKHRLKSESVFVNELIDNMYVNKQQSTEYILINAKRDTLEFMRDHFVALSKADLNPRKINEAGALACFKTALYRFEEKENKKQLYENFVTHGKEFIS